jgi:hypothetical protein
MYRGFNLKLSGEITNQKFLQTGKEIYENQKRQIEFKFDKYFVKEDVLSAKLIMEEWFPEIDTHIFLSHSHKDFSLALGIAGALKELYNIDTFIDSTIWGNSNELLKKIDDKYCFNANTSTYNYQSRNFSTTHVHLMLMNSLTRMIDNSECLFFLNTPNSTKINNDISNTTNSAWIFSELNTTKIIHKKTPDRLLRYTKMYSDTLIKAENLNESENRKFEVSYDLELSELTDFPQDKFESWLEQNYNSPEMALNNLYKAFPIDKKYINLV